MSRSQRAWSKSYALVSAVVRRVGGLARYELKARPGDGPLVRAASSLTSLSWVAMAVMSMLMCSPAVALGKISSPHRPVSAASVTRQASRTGQVALHTRRAVIGLPRPHAVLLAFGTGYSATHGSNPVRRLQRRLVALGYTPGSIDGRYGPLTERAVRGFQSTQGLHVDGIAGPLTLRALVSATPVLRPGAGDVPGGSSAVRQLQHELAAVGDRPGAADGRYGPLTKRAVMHFQRAHHLRVDGIAGPQTLDHLKRAAAKRPHHQRPRPRSHPSSTRARPRPAPATPHGTSSPARVGSAPPQRGARSGSMLWIIALIVLLVAAVGVALWRRQRHHRRTAASPPAENQGRDARPRQEVRRTAPQPTWIPERPRFLTDEAHEAAHDEHESAAVFQRGLLLLQKGDRAGAHDALRRADERGHPGAAYVLAVLLAESGDQAAAKSALRRADERGHRAAAFELGVRLLDEGDRAGAEDAFRRADDRGDAPAACNLGVLLEQRGDPVGAEDAYRRADTRGHAVGACNLGALLEQQGDLEGAREAYRRADQRGDALGTYRLGVALEGEGDRVGAERAYRRAQQRGPARISRAAQTALLTLAGTEDSGRQSARPPEVQVASEPGSTVRPSERQDERT